MGVRGHSRSLKVVPFGRSYLVSYWCSLVALKKTFRKVLFGPCNKSSNPFKNSMIRMWTTLPPSQMIGDYIYNIFAHFSQKCLSLGWPRNWKNVNLLVPISRLSDISLGLVDMVPTQTKWLASNPWHHLLKEGGQTNTWLLFLFSNLHWPVCRGSTICHRTDTKAGSESDPVDASPPASFWCAQKTFMWSYQTSCQGIWSAMWDTASCMAVGCCLIQWTETGQEKPIAFTSAKLMPTQ